MKIKKIIIAIICATMCLSVFTVNASAVSNSNIDITRQEFDKNEAYHYYLSHQGESEKNNMVVSNYITKAGTEPTKVWNLEAEDYYFSGYVDETQGANLYTSYCFLPTADGHLYVEGFAKILEPYYNQDMKIYLKDITAGTIFTVTLGENEKIHEPDEYSKFTLFYYNYRYNNLNPQHTYCIFFNTALMPTFYNVNGYIAHDWTNKLTPEM